MAAIPNVSISINAGGIGIIIPGAGPMPVNVAGWCSAGPAASPTLVNAGQVGQLTSTFGVGTAVELAAMILANGAPQGVIVTRIYDGTVASPFTRTGTGPANTVTVTYVNGASPNAPYGTATATGSTGPIVVIVLGGSVGTATFQVSLDGGVSFSAVITTAATYTIPNSNLVLNFGAGTYVAGDTYIGAITTSIGASYTLVSNVNTLMVTGSTKCQQLPVPGQTAQGIGSITMDTANNPQDAYNVIILVNTSGVIGTGTFLYSLDGGLTFNGPITIPSSNPAILGSTGIEIDFSNSGGGGGTSGFIAGETYVFSTIPPAITNADILNVGELITGSPLQWDWMHLVGRPTTASSNQPTIAAGTAIFSTLNTVASFWFSNARFSFCVQDQVPCTATANVETSLVSAYANLASNYVATGAGDVNIVSAVTGSETARCASWPASVWGSTLAIGTDLAQESLGNLPFVANILLDQNKDSTLATNRFTTMRTIPTQIGFFITNALIVSNPATSNITYWQSARVLNQACRIAYAALLTYLSKPIPVNASNGTITQAAATAIQNYVLRQLSAGLNGQVSGISCIVNTSNNVLTTQQLQVTIGVIPLFYPKYISATIGYVNPALSSQ